MSSTRTMRDPGFRWAVAPTTGWKDYADDPVRGPWHWSQFTPCPDQPGIVTHRHGWASTRDEAAEAARTA